MKKEYHFKKITHRQSVIEHTVAMVAAIFSRGAQPQHHLIPPPTFAQVLGKPCHVAFGQSLQLLDHLLTLIHRIETMDPKHNLDLDFQRQYTAKRLISGINKSTAVHDDSAQHGMDLSALVYLYSWVSVANRLLAPGLGIHPKKVYPWGVPPRVSSRDHTPPRDISPPISFSHQVCKSRCALRVSSFQFDPSSC